MRRLRHRSRLITAVLAAVAVASVASVAAVTSAAGRGTRARRAPSLALTLRSPVTVGGRNFKPGRRVTVMLIMSRRFTRTATAGAGGGFTVSFPATIDRCGPWSVTAVQGTQHVLLRSGAKPMCAPAGAP